VDADSCLLGRVIVGASCVQSPAEIVIDLGGGIPVSFREANTMCGETIRIRPRAAWQPVEVGDARGAWACVRVIEFRDSTSPLGLDEGTSLEYVGLSEHDANTSGLGGLP